MGRFRKSSATKTHVWNGQHRFEHWYRDNTVLHDYPNTRMRIELDVAISRAVELDSFLDDLPYQRYEHNRKRRVS